ncbi:MAG: Dihydrolipoamide acyltransferase component of branched-chain alpha-keto acid dehydrogenase complex [uncultured Rubrobacteraceae bacterium]|uniref:Dihydrolipoamide acetyltransferase component of pyruvate dehydrogenase complex n=1 Tax=uncultured Rubrobacteraceae bacterium TaxID=349277 RepID=A0A6J4Q7Q5_9ACTN|nr:MAG: Dihydrolipoamide acyltransferase component of branched-chain alpha-keto acid dehydrogenase complex [uncultured Rubrobacteraceae bacterium]
MATPVTMPQLGESVTEGTIARWLKAEGDEVEKDEPLCEVDTDKVSAELPSPFAGKIEKLLISEGTTVDVGTEIALVVIDGAGESTDGEAPTREDAAAEAPTEEAAAGAEAAPAAKDDERRRVLAGARSEGDGRGEVESAEALRLTRSSPVVRRLAEEHDVDIAEVSGTGIDGRVTKKDIEAYVEEREEEYAPPGLWEEREAFAPPEEQPEPETTPAREPERVEVYEGDRVMELTSIRRAIADTMSRSKREAPHAWSMVEVDVTGLVRLRERVKEEFAEREGVKLTYLPFITKAVVEGVKEYPVLNSVWDGDRILLRKRINLGVAVDLEDALIVPVIPDADELNILGLARKIDDLVRRARSKQLSPEDVAGGTFTVNNPGALGSVVSVPIINHPQAVILSAEAIVKRPVVLDDAIAVRSMMNLEVSFDHRVLDGGIALRFLNAVKWRLEGYEPDSNIE